MAVYFVATGTLWVLRHLQSLNRFTREHSFWDLKPVEYYDNGVVYAIRLIKLCNDLG
jgi:hypothetical protein